LEKPHSDKKRVRGEKHESEKRTLRIGEFVKNHTKGSV